MKSYSVSLHGHRTSVSLEPEFWAELRRLADQQNRSVASLIEAVDDVRSHTQKNVQHPSGLSSALRVHVLKTLQGQPTSSPTVRQMTSNDE